MCTAVWDFTQYCHDQILSKVRYQRVNRVGILCLFSNPHLYNSHYLNERQTKFSPIIHISICKLLVICYNGLKTKVRFKQSTCLAHLLKLLQTILTSVRHWIIFITLYWHTQTRFCLLLHCTWFDQLMGHWKTQPCTAWVFPCTHQSTAVLVNSSKHPVCWQQTYLLVR